MAETSKLKVLANKYKEKVEAEGSAHLILPGNLINISRIVPEALQVLKALHQAKFKAYLVGGCVRDMLLQKNPKDFDIVTDATPQQIKRLITNSRIIGRRFKIVHCIFKRGIIEVVTFRAAQEESKDTVANDDGMLIRDNNYGTSIEDDATRRDYTINGLYYSPYEKAIHDYHGGLYDILNQNIDIIGDPEKRFAEDPVRIIRAFRFAAKLGFKITERTMAKIPQMLPLLANVNNSRMYEEFNKLFLTGHGLKSFEILMENNVMPILLTEHGSLIKEERFSNFIKYALQKSDARTQEGKKNMPHFLYAIMLWTLVEQLYQKMLGMPKFSVLEPEVIMDKAATLVLNRQCYITSIPEKAMNDIKAIWINQIKLEDQSQINNPELLIWDGLFRASLDFLNLRGQFDENLTNLAKQWTDIYEFTVPEELRSRKQVVEFQKNNAEAISSTTPAAKKGKGKGYKFADKKSKPRGKFGDKKNSRKERREKVDIKKARDSIAK